MYIWWFYMWFPTILDVVHTSGKGWGGRGAGANSHQKIFDYGQILLLVTVVPSVFCIRTLLLFLYMLILCHPRVSLTTLLHRHYGNDVILGIKHMKNLCYKIFARLYFFKQGTFLDSKST